MYMRCGVSRQEPFQIKTDFGKSAGIFKVSENKQLLIAMVGTCIFNSLCYSEYLLYLELPITL